MNPRTQTKFEAIILFCLKHPNYITNWEYQFLESIQELMNENLNLSHKQINTLLRIFNSTNRKNIYHKAIIYNQSKNLK